MTPLHPAAAHGSQPEFLTLLIDRGAAVDAQTHSGWTPLMHAACCGLPNAMPQEAGTGYSAERNVAIINLLIQRGGGAGRPAPSFDGLTACDYAELSSPAIDGIRPLVCQ